MPRPARRRVRVPTVQPGPRARISRHTLTIQATSATERPSAWIETLKGGEITWGIRVPAASARHAVRLALSEAEALRDVVARWKSEGEPALKMVFTAKDPGFSGAAPGPAPVGGE